MSEKMNAGEFALLARGGSAAEVHDLRTTLARLTAEVEAMRAEVARLNKVHLHGCDCAPDDACLFARERDEARGLLRAALPLMHGDYDDEIEMRARIAAHLEGRR